MADRIYTDNLPLIDELVYYIKYISESIIIKDPNKADNNETLESIKDSDTYIECKESRCSINRFKISQQDLISLGIPNTVAYSYTQDYSKIPLNIQSVLLKNHTDSYINNYEEKNNYYRMLFGLPDYGEEGIKIPDNIYIDPQIKIDRSKYIHEMTLLEQNLINNLDLVPELLAVYPEYKYLNYLGRRKIGIYEARKAKDFQLLYIPDDIPSQVSERFKDYYETNRLYVLNNVYSDAFKYNSDYYDNFIAVLIIIMSFVDLLTQVSDFFIKRDIFDIRTLKLIFASNGVDYYEDIPYKYQLAMCKNLNTLIKFKATSQSIVDICSLFGCDNIQIFEYYILKSRRIQDGQYVNETITKINEDGTETIEPNLEQNYTLKFLKVPYGELADNYLYEKANYEDYDEITEADKYWDGGKQHKDIKREILQEEFNYTKSKYLSVDTVYSLADLSFDHIYFYNMIFDNNLKEDGLTINVPCISAVGNFRLSDVICYLFALTYIYMRFEDHVFTDGKQILLIKGFNFRADLQALSNYIYERGYTFKELGIENWNSETDEILTYNQLMDLYINNKKICKNIIERMQDANNKDIYDIYKKIYDTLMIQKYTTDYFTKSDGTVATTFMDYLKDKSHILYDSLVKIDTMTNETEKDRKIIDIITKTVETLESYMNITTKDSIFNVFPGVNADSIRQYIFEVVNFFKSFKMQLYNINTIYRFDDRLDNKIEIIDKIIINHNLTFSDTINLLEKYLKLIRFNPKDKIEIMDKIFIDVVNTYEKMFKENIDFIEKQYMTVNIGKNDFNSIVDSKLIISKLIKRDLLTIHDKIDRLSTLSKSENMRLKDDYVIAITNMIEKMINDNMTFKEKIDINSIIFLKDFNSIVDRVDISQSLKSNLSSRINEKILLYTKISLRDKYEIKDDIQITSTEK